MAYVLPQTRVFQEFDRASVRVARERYAHISAPHAHLVRYATADEKADGYVGIQNYNGQTVTIPNKPAGSLTDTSYTKLYMEDGLLKYFSANIASDDPVEITSINSVGSDLVFTTANDVAHSSDFLDRGVKIGDIVKIRYPLTPSGEETLWTYVSGFGYTAVASTRSAATADDGNPTTQSASSSNSQTAGIVNCVDVDSISHASYNGIRTGDITDTYTVRVTVGSTGGDATTARLEVISGSGNDDVAELTPSAFGAATDIGTRGFTATFDVDTGACVSDTPDGSSSDDFIVGQTWLFTVNQAYTAPTATAAGTYTGAHDTTYVIEVLEGGLYAETGYPTIKVTTTTGVDVSGPTVVTAAATATAVGTKGVTVAFSATGLAAGAKYYITVTAAGDGAANVLKLGHNLNTAFDDSDPIEIDLYIRKTFEVPAKRDGAPGVYNWEHDEDNDNDSIVINSSMVAYDSSWTDSGTQVALPVYGTSVKNYGKLYVEYRAWLQNLCDQIYVVDDVADLDDSISGALHPDNVLKYAVYKALSNSNGTPVKYTGVCAPDSVESWLAVIEVLNTTDEVYGLVPCTRNAEVIEAFKAHVLDVSTEVHQSWRYLWTTLDTITESAIINSVVADDNEEVLATVTDAETEGENTTITLTSGNVGFIDLDVRVGDIVRYAYTGDGYGGYTYSEGVVESIVNESVLVIASGPDAPTSVGAKIEIWRNLTAGEKATAIGQVAGAFACRRMSAVWPDRIGSAGLTVEGYHLCAGIAGLASGVVPQQGMTRLSLSGFDDVSRTTKLFTRTQLNTMAGSGVYIVTRDSAGNIFARHSLTTAASDQDLNTAEEMVTRNFDDQSYFWRDRFEPYIGISNNTPSMLDIIEAELLSGIQELRQRYYVPRLGGQVIDAQIAELRRSPIFLDQMVAELDETIPYPLNNLDVKQHVVVNLANSESRTDR